MSQEFRNRGRRVPSKGILNLIDGYPLLPDCIKSNSRLFIVGDGYYKPMIKERLDSSKLSSYIILVGFTKDIKNYLKKGSLWILPSEGGGGLPVSLLEAMSAGIPCIISNFQLPYTYRNAIIYLQSNSPKVTLVQNRFFILDSILTENGD